MAVSDYRKREESITFSSEPVAESETHELLTLNIGPHHPATHGVLRLIATLEGEVVRDVKPIIGYVHTGIEKTAEEKSYWKVIPVVERMDYLSYYFNAMAYCCALVPSQIRWEAIRLSSRWMTRRYWARRGTSTSTSVSTAQQ